MLAFKDKKPKHKAVRGENMDGDDAEKESLEDIPDVTADDYKDTSVKTFSIVLKAKGNRKVFMSKEKLGVDRVAKIKVNPHPRNSMFFFDARTNTIRLASERNFALSNTSGKGLKQGHNAVFRRILDAKVMPDQVLNIKAHSISNKGKKCLEVKGKNADMAAL